MDEPITETTFIVRRFELGCTVSPEIQYLMDCGGLCYHDYEEDYEEDLEEENA